MSNEVEIAVRLGFFGGVLLVMTLWELLAPRRPLTVRKAPRWASNLGLVVLNVNRSLVVAGRSTATRR